MTSLLTARQWRYAAVGLILGILSAALITAALPRAYTASMVLSVSTQSSTDSIGAYQGELLAEQKAKAYAQLLTGPRVTQDTVSRLGLPMTAAELAQNMSVSVQPNSTLISLNVTAGSPARAAEIADTLALSLSDLVDEMEKLTDQALFHAGSVNPVAPARAPSTPVSPNVPLNLWLGGVLGILLGFAASWVRTRLDTSVRSQDGLRRILNTPDLPVVALDKKSSTDPLAATGHSGGARAEAYRHLKGIVSRSPSRESCRSVLVCSSVPGEGRTTVSCNLALALASPDTRVLLIEADFRRPRLAEIADKPGDVGLIDVLADVGRLEEAVSQWHGNLDVLVAGRTPSDPSELLGSLAMATVMSRIRELYDYVIIDTPALLPVSETTAIGAVADSAIFVCRYGRTKARFILEATDRLRSATIYLCAGALTTVPDRLALSAARYGRYAATPVPMAMNGGSSARTGSKASRKRYAHSPAQGNNLGPTSSPDSGSAPGLGSQE